MNKDKYGFYIIETKEDLKQAVEAKEIQVSIACNCCNRQLICSIETAQIIFINNKNIYFKHDE